MCLQAILQGVFDRLHDPAFSAHASATNGDKGKHAHSYSERKHKMGAMIGTCYRIQRNSFSDELLIKELREKTREWQECLKYTPKFVLSAIKYLANKHVEGVWAQAHKALLGDSV